MATHRQFSSIRNSTIFTGKFNNYGVRMWCNVDLYCFTNGSWSVPR